jgi:hypothetical protein
MEGLLNQILGIGNTGSGILDVMSNNKGGSNKNKLEEFVKLNQNLNKSFVNKKEFDTNVYGEPVAPVDVNALTQQFYSILGDIQNKREQERVIQIFQMSDDEGKIEFMQQIVDNPNMATGYGIQDEGNMYTGENTPTKNFSNLGFN